MNVSLRGVSSPKLASGRILAPILAIDYGRRRIGVAVSDALALTVRPLQTLGRTNRRNDLRRLRTIVRAHGIRQIVVGHPLHLDGSTSEMAAEAARFAERLRKHLGLPVELVDEGLSSWEAEEMLRAAKPKGRRRASRQHQVDQFAAAVILRDFLGQERARLERPSAPQRPTSGRPRRATKG